MGKIFHYCSSQEALSEMTAIIPLQLCVWFMSVLYFPCAYVYVVCTCVYVCTGMLKGCIHVIAGSPPQDCPLYSLRQSFSWTRGLLYVQLVSLAILLLGSPVFTFECWSYRLATMATWHLHVFVDSELQPSHLHLKLSALTTEASPQPEQPLNFSISILR